jgi:hypothetical protein
MTHVNISNTSSSEPRYLTTSEIDDIVNSYPLCSKTEHGRLYTENIRKIIRNDLELILITPDGLNDLKDYLITQHYKSESIPGESVGMYSCEAIGASATQGTLNTFHQSGSGANQTAFIENVKDKLYVKKESKSDIINIYFKNPRLTLEDVFNYRKDIIETKIWDLIKKHDYIDGKDFVKEDWHRKCESFLGKNVNVGFKVMRIYFDIEKLYKFKVLMYNIYKKLTLNDNYVEILFSPTNIGIMDIFVDIEQNSSLLEKYKIPIYDGEISLFEVILVPQLKALNIKGIDGLHGFFISKFDATKVISEEVKCPKLDRLVDNASNYKNLWILYYDSLVLSASSISKDNFEELIINSGQKIVKRENNRIFVASNEDISPIELINKKELNFKYYHVQTYGINLIKVLHLDFVDARKTYSTNPHVMFKHFGIEATRNMLLKEIYGLFSGAGINYINILTAVDFITNGVGPKALNSTGISNQPEGPLSKASVDRAGQYLTNAALTMKTENMKSVSSSIIIGKTIPTGNGYVNIGCESNGKIFINENTFDYMVPKDRCVTNDMSTENIMLNNYDENEDYNVRELDNKKLIDSLRNISNNIKKINSSIAYSYDEEEKEYIVKNKNMILEENNIKYENIDENKFLSSIIGVNNNQQKEFKTYNKSEIQNQLKNLFT